MTINSKYSKMNENTIKERWENVNAKLIALKEKFSYNERFEYALKNDMGISTVQTYMKGEGSSLITAEQMCEDITDLVEKKISKQVA